MPKVDKRGPSKKIKHDAEVELWQRRLELAEQKLKDKGGDVKAQNKGSTAGWRGLINFFKGDQWSRGMGGKEKTFDRITANQAKSNIDSIRPQLYFQNPRIKITVKNPQITKVPIGIDGQPVPPQMPPLPGMPPPPPPQIAIQAGRPVAMIGGKTVDALEQANLIQSIDNYYFEETDFRGKARRIVNDSLILPYGVSKWEWIIETAQEEEIGEDGLPTGKKIETIARQYAHCSRVKPWCILWDSELEEFDLDQAEWVAEVKYLSEEDIKADKLLQNTDDLPEPAYYVDEGGSSKSRSQNEEFARYRLFEIHDLRHNEFLVWIDGADKINRKESPSPYAMVEGSIFTLLGYDDVPDDSFPLSIVDQIKSKGEGYNKVLSYMVNHVSRFNRKYKMLEKTMDEAELEKWERGEDGVTLMVKDMMSGPEPITDAPINADVYNVANILKREITEDIGVSAYNRAGREPGVDTAFEANLIQGGADIKIQEKRDIVRAWVRKNIKKLNQIVKSYADMPTIVEVAGEQGSRWVEWTSKDIQGEFLEDVDIYSTLPFSEEVEKKQAMEMYSLAAADPYFNPFKVRTQVIRTMKWPEDLLYNEQEFNARMQQQQQQAQQQAALQENQRQQSQTMRPTKGPQSQNQVKRGPDMRAGVAGPARNYQ